MNAAFSAFDWLELLGLGGIVGALGQGMRMVVGFKKLHDASSAGNVGVLDLVAMDRLLVPLGIGFIAGALAAAGSISDLAHISGQQILAIAAAGYAGADFIEGFMSRVAPAADLPAGEEGVGVAPPAPPSAVPAPPPPPPPPVPVPPPPAPVAPPPAPDPVPPPPPPPVDDAVG
jgi:hypothetical protein